MPRNINNKMNRIIGRSLKQARLEMGFTCEQIASQIDVTQQQWYKYESGENNISAARLWAVAKLTNKPVAYFYNVSEEFPLVDRNKVRILRLIKAWQSVNDNQKHTFLDLLESIVQS